MSVQGQKRKASEAESLRSGKPQTERKTSVYPPKADVLGAARANEPAL